MLIRLKHLTNAPLTWQVYIYRMQKRNILAV
uniref:Uncharacterized protein n=1 Tax=Rhizophora mucronata TaxID=61149 RepID=A0A2P2R133_RHIMU